MEKKSNFSTFKEQEHFTIVSALRHVICDGRESEETHIPELLHSASGINVETDGAVYAVPTTTFSDKLNRNECLSSSSGACEVTKKYIGVRKRPSRKWAAEIWDPSIGKVVWIGTFETDVEAARARDIKAIEIHKEKAKTNFPLSDYIEILKMNKNVDDNDRTKTTISSISIESGTRIEQGTIVTVGTIELDQSNSCIAEITVDENSYNWSFDNNDEYELPEWKIIDSP